MFEITNQSMCVIGIILCIVLIPKYLRLPKSLELLYQDKFGQLLLLILAVVVGSYNFTCGVLLALLFLSIILQTTGNIKSIEGFEDVNPEMEEDDDMKLNEEFVDIPDETNTSVPSLDVLSQELQDTQKQLKILETDFNKYQKKESKKPVVQNTEMDLEMNKKVEKAKKMIPDETSSSETKKSLLKNKEETIEGFGCGSDSGSSSRNDEQRIKLLKYEEANMKDFSLIEPFINPSKDTFNPYDSVGCKFDVNFQPRNEFINGPPVSSCDAYSNINLKQTGTVFYPLN